MWIMLPLGAFSVTERPTRPPGDERNLQVRARRREWLEALREAYCPELGEPVHYENADYQWRCFVTPQQWAETLARIANAIDYSNFKGATLDPRHSPHSPQQRQILHLAYSRCWSALLEAGDGTSCYDSPLARRARKP
jgi:hypothetical protein